jgi:hypothetical protein
MNQLAIEERQEREQRQNSYPINLPANAPVPTGALGNVSSTSIFTGTVTGTGFLLASDLILTTRHVTEKYQTTLTLPVAQQPSPGRTTGPVRVLKKIADDWNLSQRELAHLLAYLDPQVVDNVFNGITTLRGPDREDRVRIIYEIYRVLVSLFVDLQDQRNWLRTPNPFLNERAPLEVMIADRIPGMIRVRDLVDRLAGR